MSGGIDSSVASMILQNKGHNLCGATFITYNHQDTTDETPEIEAKKLADKMGFLHHTLDLRKEFREIVIDNFINEYLNGRTPNPCVICNPTIKWGKLIEFADQHNCQYIATGHYARIGTTPEGRFFLKKGIDDNKDQTYFLWRLPQQFLARTLFPLGEISKPEARDIALNNGFVSLSQKSESQEICFIKDDNYRRFLEENVKDYHTNYSKGNYIDKNNIVLGQHQGFPNYTIGQRKGLGIALGTPMYVTNINASTNEVTLGPREELTSTSCVIKDINMMKIADFIDGMEVMVKVRYKSRPTLANIYHQDNNIRIQFQTPIESITPGQSAVIYTGTNWEDILGGGIII